MDSAASPSPPRVAWRWLRWIAPRSTIAYTLVVVFGGIFLGWHLLIPGSIALLLLLIMADGFGRPSSQLFYPTVLRGPRGTQRVALTFDDGPDPEVTPAVLEILARHRVHATFFVIGKSLAAQPDLAARMVRAGHVLGNHSWEHSHWHNFYLTRRHEAEMARCDAAIAAVNGQSTGILYRPPVGLKSPELARAAWRRHLTLVAWSLHSHDSRRRDAAAIARRVLDRVRGGDIILMHDGHHAAPGVRSHSAEALELILQGLAARGLECVTVPELLAQPG